MNKIELLAPAGDLNRGKIALDFGADAIYFGGKQYSLRARASNFTNDDLCTMIAYAHAQKKQAYLVTNIVCHNRQLSGFDQFLQEVIKTSPDAFLCADPAIIHKIQKKLPHATIHVSTQQSVTNSKSALFWKRNGAHRIVMAREVSFSEIKQTIAQLHNAIEIEMFVHGAVCIAYSGRCMLSSNMCLRDANNGGCAQSCRWVSELSKNGKSLNQQFSMSAKDMRLIKYLNDIKHIGVSAIKIEGRMKSEHYIATIVNAYRKILDHGINVEYINDVASAASREVSCAWFNGSPTKNEMLYHEVPKNVNQIFAMVIDKKINQYTYQVTSRNYFTLTNNFEVLGKNLKHIEPIKLLSIKDDNGLPIRIVNTPMSKLIIEIKQDLDLQPLDMIRIKK